METAEIAEASETEASGSDPESEVESAETEEPAADPENTETTEEKTE